MRLRELILELEELYREEGDVRVVVETAPGAHVDLAQVNSGYWVNRGERGATLCLLETEEA